MINHLLPQDTRAVEIVSSLSLILIGASLMHVPFESELFSHHSHKFWSAITILFGLLQLLSVVFSEKLPLIRTLISWSIGFFFVWLGFSSISQYNNISDYIAIILGFGNWYAFILNINFMRKEWIS